MMLTRRDFLLATAGALGVHHVRPAAGRAETLRIGFVTPGEAVPGEAAPATLGARLGAEEAARAAALFGGAVEMVTDAAPRALLDARVHVLVGGADDDEAERLSALAERAGVPFVNVGATSDALRAERCRSLTFHVAASAAMRRAARESVGDGDVLLWHESLTQYGAAQLNDRFRARFQRAMTDDAWAAWMAIKVASEAALRTRTNAGPALASYLVRPGVRFDGHKGRPLSFGASDHQLHQPLYRLAPGASSAVEIPAVDVAPAAGAPCGSGKP